VSFVVELIVDELGSGSKVICTVNAGSLPVH
jgi:hypothetical protein